MCFNATYPCLNKNMEVKKNHLSDEQLEVTQNCGTEPPFSGKLLNEKREGTYGPVNKIGISCMFAQHLHLHPVAGL